MKIAFICGPHFISVKHFNLHDIWNDPRGLTGSEYSYLRVAKEMHNRGHDVHLFTLQEGSPVNVWEGLSVHHFNDITSIDDSYHAAISWNEAEPFRHVSPQVLRVVSFQINSFYHCRPGFDDYVDVWASPSEGHKQMLINNKHWIGTDFGIQNEYYDAQASGSAKKWIVVPHGVDLDNYDKLFEQGLKKAKGRVIWASSPDRGLHWLLQEWTKIKRNVPYAHLKIFYRLKPWIDTVLSLPAWSIEHEEMIMRASYVKEGINRLQSHGVQLIDAVSRIQINREMAEAQVYPYTCSTTRWTEGFSVTLLETCAARACPITTATDALAGIYGHCVPIVELPLQENIGKFSDLTIQALVDDKFREGVNEKVRAFAETLTWTKVVAGIEKMLVSRLKH